MILSPPSVISCHHLSSLVITFYFCHYLSLLVITLATLDHTKNRTHGLLGAIAFGCFAIGGVAGSRTPVRRTSINDLYSLVLVKSSPGWTKTSGPGDSTLGFRGPLPLERTLIAFCFALSPPRRERGVGRARPRCAEPYFRCKLSASEDAVVGTEHPRFDSVVSYCFLAVSRHLAAVRARRSPVKTITAPRKNGQATLLGPVIIHERAYDARFGHVRLALNQSVSLRIVSETLPWTTKSPRPFPNADRHVMVPLRERKPEEESGSQRLVT